MNGNSRVRGSLSVSGGAVTLIGYNVFPDPSPSAPVGRSNSSPPIHRHASPLAAHPFQTIGFASGNLPFNALPLLAIGTFNQRCVPAHRQRLDVGLRHPVINLHPMDGLPHRYRIDWSATAQIDFYIDGVLTPPSPHCRTAAMRPAISDFNGSWLSRWSWTGCA